MKKFLSLLLTALIISTFSFVVYASPLKNDNNIPQAEVECLGVFSIEEESQLLTNTFDLGNLFTGDQSLNTNSNTVLWSDNNSPYVYISCYNHGDTDNGTGAIRFTINGQIQDVNAGQGANFRVKKGGFITVSAKALWYNGTYRLEIKGSKK